MQLFKSHVSRSLYSFRKVMLVISISLFVAACGGSGNDAPQVPQDDPAATPTDPTILTDSGTSVDQSPENPGPGPEIEPEPTPSQAGTQNTFDTLVGSNQNVREILAACRGTYDEFNNSFLRKDVNAVQIATEVKGNDGSQSVDAVQVQWIFTSQAVVTTQDTAIEANSAGGVFLIREGGCSVNVFQGFGLNQDKTDSLQRFQNPSDVVLACVDQIPSSATTNRKYPLYRMAGKDYGLYRHDYTDTTETARISYKQIYETRFNGSEYYIACPEAEEIAREVIEAAVGTAPSIPSQVSLEPVADKTFRISWEPSTGAEFYRVLENPDGVSGFNRISGDLDPSTQRFNHRVALYSRLNARYIVQACNTNGCADSDELMLSGTLERAIGYFKASNTNGGVDESGDTVGDRFGVAVSLSADGHTLAVAAFEEDSLATGVNGDQDDDSAESAGAVYVFARINGKWQQQAYLKASNTDAGDEFGRAVSLSADGNTLAIGATVESSSATGINGNQNDNSAFWSGAVYIFERGNGSWQQQSYLKASNTELRDEFGKAISLSADGNTLAVGAPYEASSATGINGNQNDNTAFSSGAVYVFVRSDGAWQQYAYLKASNTNEELVLFGEAVSLSADGKTLAVGAYGEDSLATGINGNQGDRSAFQSGAVYVFAHSNGSWQQQAYLKASNTNSFDFFGGDVSLSADGNTLAVGASGEDSVVLGVNGNESDNSASDSGAAYIFVRIDGNWQQQAYLKASNTEAGDGFGIVVSLSADGISLAIGARGEESAATGINGDQYDNSIHRSGAVYMFEQISGIWQQQAYLKASNNRQEDSHAFIDAVSMSVSLSADGKTLAVGELRESSAATGVNGNQDDNSAPGSGAVYLY